MEQQLCALILFYSNVLCIEQLKQYHVSGTSVLTAEALRNARRVR